MTQPYPYTAPPAAPAAYPYPAPVQPNPYAAPAAPAGYPAYPVAQAPTAPAPIQLPTSGGIGVPAATNDPSLVRPKVSDLGGRLLLMRPTKLEQDVPSTVYKNPDNTPVVRDRLTVDVIVLDGEPFQYGGSPEQGKPHTHMAQVIPFEIPGLFINQTVLVAQLKPALAPGGVPMICGRLGKVPSKPGQPPAWKLTDATAPELALANQYVASRQTMSAPQPAARQAPVYSAPPAPQAGPYAPMPAPVPSAPPAAYAPQAPAQPAYAPVPAPVPQGYQCPPGMDPATWATYTPDQQLSVWHQIQAQPQG